MWFQCQTKIINNWSFRLSQLTFEGDRNQHCLKHHGSIPSSNGPPKAIPRLCSQVWSCVVPAIPGWGDVSDTLTSSAHLQQTVCTRADAENKIIGMCCSHDFDPETQTGFWQTQMHFCSHKAKLARRRESTLSIHKHL